MFKEGFMRPVISGFALAVALMAPSVHAETTDTAKIDAAVRAALSVSETPSASVAVVRDGQIVFAKAYGDAVAGAKPVKATAATRYQIASVSKEFTAAAILLLLQDGKLSLDDKVGKWLPELNLTSANDITVRQVLAHTSGYSDFWPQDYVMKTMTVSITPAEVAKRFAGAPLDYAPGTDWQYSNTGYIVAGLIVEKASGQPLFDFVRERILKPVGITDAVDVSSVDLKAPDALGYERIALGPDRLTLKSGHGWMFGDAYLGLTASDVAKWDISVMKRSLFKPETYDTQVTTVKLNNGKDTGYAMGLFISKPNGHTLIEHTGEGAGYLSENRIYPDDKFAVVVLTNTMSGRAFLDVADRVTAVFLPPQGQDAGVLQVLEDLRAGKADRDKFTDNLNGYLSDQAVGDIKSSLGGLGAASGFRVTGSELRGGMTFKSYSVRLGAKPFRITVYITKDGKLEQFLVSAA